VNVNRPPGIALEAGVEQTGRVLQRRALGEGHFDYVLVGLSRADDAAVGPDRNARRCRLGPLPLFDDLRVGRMDDFANSGEHLPAPVPEFLDLRIDLSRGSFHRDAPYMYAANLATIVDAPEGAPVCVKPILGGRSASALRLRPRKSAASAAEGHGL